MIARDHASKDLGMFDESFEHHSLVLIVRPVEMFLKLEPVGVRLELLHLLDEVLIPQGEVGIVVKILTQEPRVSLLDNSSKPRQMTHVHEFHLDRACRHGDR